MNRLHIQNILLGTVLIIILALSLGADVQFKNINSGSDPVIDTNVRTGPANSVHAVWGDYDLDGDEDLYVVNDGSPNHLYRNNTCSYDLPCESVGLKIAETHSISFTKMTSAGNPGLAVLRDGVSSSKFAHWVDYDQDGDLDLYLVNDGMNRLFINELFDPTKPYNPFSIEPVKRQIIGLDRFTYKAHPEIKLTLGSQDFMQIVTTVVVPTGVGFPRSGTPDIFEDLSIDFLQVSPQVVPGMYLQISQAADIRKNDHIYSILEVVGANQLRLDYEGDLQNILEYRLLRDTKAELINIERFEKSFQTDGVLNEEDNSLEYVYIGSDTSLNLNDRQIFEGDQVIFSSGDASPVRTLANITDVIRRSFAVTPPPSKTNGDLFLSDFDVNVRRRGGEVLLQKIFTDLRVGFPVERLTRGDEIEVVSGVNKGRRYKIEEFAQNQVVFLDSSPGSTVLSAFNEEFEYELIYNRINTKTRRILTDGGAAFGPIVFEPGTRQVKVGDHIVIDPDLSLGVFNRDIASNANAGNSNATVLGVRTTFDDGTPRPPGVIRVKEVLAPLIDGSTSQQLIVDAFPSEVIQGYRNQNFPYQIRHRFGQLSGQDGFLSFFKESAPNGPAVLRDFSGSFNFSPADIGQNKFLIIISDSRPDLPQDIPLMLQPNRYEVLRLNNDGVLFNQLELGVAIDETTITTTNELSYRPIYSSLGAQDPVSAPKVLRIFNTDILPPGVGAGSSIVLRGFFDTLDNPIRLNRVIQIERAATGTNAGIVDLTLAEDMPDELIQNFIANCTSSVDPACDINDNNPDVRLNSRLTFFTLPGSDLSVQYEFITSNTKEPGVPPLELKVEGEVTVFTDGLPYSLLSLTAGDSLEYKDPLTGSIRTSEILTLSSLTTVILSNVDATVPPYNVDIPAGVTGFKPIYRGLLSDFRTITSSNPAINFTSMAHPLDKLAYFSMIPNQGLSLVARVDIAEVAPTFVQIRKLSETALANAGVSTNPFFFRFTRTSGQSAIRDTFRDSRPGLDFTRSLNLNPDGSIRGRVLLDVYRTSSTITDPLFKRFTLTDILSVNRIGLESGTVNIDTDIFNNYYYEISQLDREQGGIIENHTGNGRKVEFADWNKDGLKDIYVLNSGDELAAEGNTDLSLIDQNSSLLLLGTTNSSISTGLSFIEPLNNQSNNQRELENKRPSDSAATLPLQPRAVLNSDLNNDLEPDLYILNADERDKFLLSGVTEGAIDFELNAIVDNPLQLAFIFGENDLVIGDINRDGTKDLYYLVGRDPDPVSLALTGPLTPTSNVLFLSTIDATGANIAFTKKTLEIEPDSLLNTMQQGYSLSGAILDYNNDGYVDINVMNNDLVYLAETKFDGLNSIGGASITIPAECGFSGPGYNRHIAWTDANMDGWPDFYVSRASDTGETNALCIAEPDDIDKTNNFFIVDLIPRDLAGRADKKIKLGRVTMLYLDPTSNKEKSIIQDFEYNYPYPEVIKFSTGPIDKVTFVVNWSDQHEFNYGSFMATSGTTGKRIKLEQPGDIYVSNNKNLESLKSSPISSAVTNFVGPQTTNIEAVGFTVMAGKREPVTLETLSIFFAGTNFETPDAIEKDFIPRGSIKLFLDASEQDRDSDDFKNFTPDGEYNIEHDVEIAAAPLSKFFNSGGPNNQTGVPGPVTVYNDTLDEKGIKKLGENEILGVQFTNLVYQSRDKQTITSFVLNPSLDGGLAERLSFLVVFTSDINQAGTFFRKTNELQVLPYLPKRLYQGAISSAKNAGENLAPFLNNPFDQSLEVELRGKRSNQINRGVLLDSTLLGSNEMTVFSTFPFSSLPISNDNLVGLKATVVQSLPNEPLLDATVPTEIKETSIKMFGTADAFTTVKIVNESAGSEPVLTKVKADGTWTVQIDGLTEGTNKLSFLSVDIYGNESPPRPANVVRPSNTSPVDIKVDLTPPTISQEIVTNIGIARATISWITDEPAVSTIILTSPSIPFVEQEFLELDQFNPRKEHEVKVGEPNRMYSGFFQAGGTITVPNALECQSGIGEIDSLALCPDTNYNVSIEVKDKLGNVRRIENVLIFRTLQKSEILRDLDNDGLLDQDTDGDGIPDSIEADPDRFPDLDMFDANDALLDFDEDGINNIEEFKNGTDMYNPFDVLPIANAGKDQVLDPGIIILDSSDSNQNDIATSELDFRWVMESAPNQNNQTNPASPPVIDNPNAQRTYFTARKSGIYRVSLQILTFQGAESKKDEVIFEVRNIAPKANAGLDSTGRIFEDIVLDGRSSSDSNGDPLTYRWIQLQGPDLANQGEDFGIVNDREAKTSFKTNRTGRYVFELVVRDVVEGLSTLTSRDQVTILVNSAVDIFPIADAGDDIIASQNEPINLQGDRSGGSSASSNLVYNWELINSVTQNVPEECESFRTNDATSVILEQGSLRNPQAIFTEPGKYAFKLRVQESGKGLESSPDCVKVVVNRVNDPLPISRPQVFGEPIKLSNKLAGTTQNINPSLAKEADEAISVYRVPINYEVQLSGLDSYPSHDIIASKTANNFTQIGSDQNCFEANTAYSWRQITGDELKMYPIVADCSVVKFTPINVGSYTFALKLKSMEEGVPVEGIERTVVVLAHNANVIPENPNDPCILRSPGENNFVPTVQAPDDLVIKAGEPLVLSSPKCMDQDLLNSQSTCDAPFGSNVIPEDELISCSATLSLSCIWSQVNGPPLNIQNPNTCSPTVLNVNEGTYTVSVRVFDGEYYSLADEMTFVAIGVGGTVPQANAGTDIIGRINQEVTLNGGLSIASAGSFDFLWKQIEGMPVPLRRARTVSPSFIPVAQDKYRFELQVQDDKGIRSLPDMVEVFVPPNASVSNVNTGELGTNNDSDSQQRLFEQQGGGGGGGCFIATATSGAQNSWLVNTYCSVRDKHLLNTEIGILFVKNYYKYSPPIAESIAKSTLLRIGFAAVLYPIALVIEYPLSILLIFLLFMTLIANFSKSLRLAQTTD